ncbi:helix-turn-helix domain-containing protein [Haloarchaeobius amylolyticus]|uniref:helix-turn-helix domain-containing protein n=1 Tax=Haloarchaeobius amylolyticus TaxID=1198296 RepID=UPI00227149B8|nr:helix-turn-helix domain-containing protein [Haloarchaeobius amylolyticus]
MASGIRAELSICEPSVCRVATVSSEYAPVETVTRSGVPGDGEVVGEFSISERLEDEGDLEEVYSTGSDHVYRFSRDCEHGCVCEHVESYGYPVRDLRAEDGVIHLTFYVCDVESLREVVTSLRSDFDGVSVRRLTRSEPCEDAEDLVFVDRQSLTDRQREVLETAHEHGYFAHPRESNATEVAAHLDITRSTFAEHLAAAQKKLLDDILTV